ncbi:MAG: hypothetical protein QME12_04440 [Nanoarchaeota archaeon]|nr:hypothetical protein [Nanoarchaeota archaeon]
MTETANLIVGGGIIAINLIPLLLRKPKYFLLTSVISVIMALLLIFMRSSFQP